MIKFFHIILGRNLRLPVNMLYLGKELANLQIMFGLINYALDIYDVHTNEYVLLHDYPSLFVFGGAHLVHRTMYARVYNILLDVS